MPSDLDLGSPFVVGLLGCQLWTQGSEAGPQPNRRCWCCGAVRDSAGKVVSGGIRRGDPMGCAACTCLEPGLERTAHRRGKPPREAKRRGRPKATLSAKDRRHLMRSIPGRVWLAMKDAEAVAADKRLGPAARDVAATLAGRLQVLLYRLRDREIDEAELDRQAGLTPEDSAAA